MQLAWKGALLRSGGPVWATTKGRGPALADAWRAPTPETLAKPPRPDAAFALCRGRIGGVLL